MLGTRAVDHKINRLHERGLGALLSDETSTFNDIISKTNDTTIHVKKLNATNSLSAPIMKEVFTTRIFKYNLSCCRVTLLQLWSSYQGGIKICHR